MRTLLDNCTIGACFCFLALVGTVISILLPCSHIDDFKLNQFADVACDTMSQLWRCIYFLIIGVVFTVLFASPMWIMSDISGMTIAQFLDARSPFILLLLLLLFIGSFLLTCMSFRWLLQAVAQCIRFPQLVYLHCGYKYYYGWGVHKDYAESLRWLLRVHHPADINYLLPYMIAECYYHEMNYLEAYKWYRRYAELVPDDVSLYIKRRIKELEGKLGLLES